MVHNYTTNNINYATIDSTALISLYFIANTIVFCQYLHTLNHLHTVMKLITLKQYANTK